MEMDDDDEGLAAVDHLLDLGFAFIPSPNRSEGRKSTTTANLSLGHSNTISPAKSATTTISSFGRPSLMSSRQKGAKETPTPQSQRSFFGGGGGGGGGGGKKKDKGKEVCTNVEQDEEGSRRVLGTSTTSDSSQSRQSMSCSEAGSSSFNGGGRSSIDSTGTGAGKRGGWVSKLGRVVSGRRTANANASAKEGTPTMRILEEREMTSTATPSPALIRLAEKVVLSDQSDGSSGAGRISATLSNERPSRIPIASLLQQTQFSSNILERQEPPFGGRRVLRPRPRAVYEPTEVELASCADPSPSSSPLPVMAPPNTKATSIATTLIPRIARPVVRKTNLPPPSTKPIHLVPASELGGTAQILPSTGKPSLIPQNTSSRLPFKRPAPPPQPALLPPVQLQLAIPKSSFLGQRSLGVESSNGTTGDGVPGTNNRDSTSSDGSEHQQYTPPSPSPNRRSFRSPSPARFRDLLPSPSASSSPEKNERGLPTPNVSPKSAKKGDSPKKRAMGPEQIIEMEAALAEHQAGLLSPTESGITEVCGATSDLANLLSALDDTTDLDLTRDGLRSLDRNLRAIPSNKDLTSSLRMHLPHVDSIESLRSTVSDVPDDLKELIQSVDDHISEVEVSMFGDLEVDVESCLGPSGLFEDEDHEETIIDGEDLEEEEEDSEQEEEEEDVEEGGQQGFVEGPNTEEILDGYRSESATEFLQSKLGGIPSLHLQPSAVIINTNPSPTVSSFEGHVSTAAMALRSMLEGPGPGQNEPRYTRRESFAVAEEKEQRHHLRDSVIEYLAMERPTCGDKMMDRMDIEVSLTSLMDGNSPPDSPIASHDLPRRPPMSDRRPQLQRAESSSSSGTGSSMSLMGSPTPANGLRRSIVRYSANPTRIKPRQRPDSVQSLDSSFDADEQPENEPHNMDFTSVSLAQSTRSTNLSISSVNSSPCPVNRRRVPMLTKHYPPPSASYRFPAPPRPPKAAHRASNTVSKEKVVPWKDTLRSGSPGQSTGERNTDETSPFKKTFNPLEQFRMKAQRKNSDENTNAPTEEISSSRSSPRFVRPLQPPRAGDGVPRPTPLVESDGSNSLIPPDTPPPSSPSISEFDSKRSSVSSVSCTRPAGPQFDLPSHTIVSSYRSSKGHSRQLSRASSIIQDTIVEEEIRDSPNSSPTMPNMLRQLDLGEPFGLETIIEPLSPAHPSQPSHLKHTVTSSRIAANMEPLVIVQADNTPSDEVPAFNICFANHPHATLHEVDNHVVSEDDDFDDDYDEKDDSFLIRTLVHLSYEADMEIRRSLSMYPDTDASREAMAHFVVPSDYIGILDFLLDSQHRFKSAKDAKASHAPSTHPFYYDQYATSIYPEPDSFPVDPTTPPTPPLLPDTISNDDEFSPAELTSLSPPSEQAQVQPHPVSLISHRRPLGEKPVNRKIAALADSTSNPRKEEEEVLSPFTALPPKISGKLRGLKAKLGSSPSPNKKKKKKNTVDVTFLGAAKPTKRRQTQWDVSLSRLEGEGDPAEQRSDDESTCDLTGVLEGSGEGKAFPTFYKNSQTVDVAAEDYSPSLLVSDVASSQIARLCFWT
ncbi:hypothetical protein T439DRAFT_347790 [Meredithblackwellia eburnea MCA 4105]